MSTPDHNVRCGDCFWEGPALELIKKDELHYCPKCGREIMKFSLPSGQPDGAG